MRDFYLVHLPESSGSDTGGKPQVDMVGKAQPHNMGREVPESKTGRAFGHGGQIHLEEIDGKFPVDVVKLELMLILLVFGPILGRQPGEGIQVIRTVFVDTFVDIEMLAVFLLNKGMTTVGTKQGYGLHIGFPFDKPVATDFAKQLATTTCIVVKVSMRGSTTGTHTIWRDRIFPTGIDGLEVLAMFGFVLFKQKDVVQLLPFFDNRQFVNGMLIVLGASNIVLWRLKRYIFHNKQ
jgi:hypothetical protein